MKDEGKKPRSYQFVVSVEDGTCTSEILSLKVMLGEKKGERRGEKNTMSGFVLLQ